PFEPGLDYTPIMMTTGQDALQMLLDLTRQLSKPIELKAKLQTTTDAALALLPEDHASLHLFDNSKTELLSNARSSTGVTQRPTTFRRGQGLMGSIAETGRTTLVPDALQDPRFVAHPTQDFTMRSVVTMPLVAGGDVIDVLSMSSAHPKAFDEADR